jgi:DNA polymerase (family 10)
VIDKRMRQPVSNADIARIFARYSTLLEIEGANSFRVRAYQNAARLIQGLPKSIPEMLAEGADLTELEGIGEDLAGKIGEIVTTRHLGVLEEIEKRMPAALVELTGLPGLGPKRVKLLYDKLQTGSLKDLERAARSGRVREIPGFGPKTEEKILQAIATRRTRDARVGWVEAEQVAKPFVEALAAVPGVQATVVAGSFRRYRRTVGDLDILVACANSRSVMQRFLGDEDVAEVLAGGPTRATVRLHNGLQVDLRVVPEASYGAALQYFTGSKAHNIALRARGQARAEAQRIRIVQGSKARGRPPEQKIYRHLKLPYIEPELREGLGEIAAAEKGELPELVALGDLRGDLHSHTNASDGHDTIDAMASAARALGYEYLAISDHTQHLRIANGLDRKRLKRQLAKIDRLNDKFRKFRLLKSAEVDILDDGSLDLPDSLLRELDVVVCAVHYKFELSRDKQTERIIRAMDNPYFNILAHPSGRLLGEREAYAVDLERIMAAALERGCFLEVNAQPQRLDLGGSECHMARDMGLKVAVSTDSHSVEQLANMRLGVAQARRGWLEAGNVLNTRTWPELRRLLKRA